MEYVYSVRMLYCHVPHGKEVAVLTRHYAVGRCGTGGSDRSVLQD